jgi:hypothetical protein
MILLFSGLQAGNNVSLIGNWEIVRFEIVHGGKSTVSDEESLKNGGAIWNMSFSEDGSFKQEFNMRNAGLNMETETGTWQTRNDSLFIEIKMDTLVQKLQYYYVLLGDAVVLTLQHPTLQDKVVTKFRRQKKTH